MPSTSILPVCALVVWKLNLMFPTDPATIEQIALRWTHIVAGFLWLGFLYFFVLSVNPALKSLDGATRAKVFPELASRGLWWLRWSAVVGWIAGIRYFTILARTDAVNAGKPNAWAGWIALWAACWLAAFGIELILVRASGRLANTYLAGTLIFFVMLAASCLVVSLLARPGAGNRTLCIAIGGGLGTILFLNVWEISWPCQKRLIAWTRAAAEQGTPLPPEAPKLARMAAFATQINFWLSFPMLFFMASSAHFPFLSGQ